MKYSISVLAMNNLALTRRCIESILQHSPKGEYELLLTDNGSSDGTFQYFDSLLDAHPHIRVWHNPQNMGFISPNRLALDQATGEIHVFLNNDIQVVPRWLEILAAPFATNPNAALSGPEGNCCHILPNCHGTMGPFEYLEGSCLMGRTDILRKHGLFPPELSGAYGEDSCLSLRMREKGYTLHRVPLKMPHVRGATSAMVPQARKWQEDNHAFLKRRFAHYLRVRNFEFPIIVKRTDAWGDVLLTTPIVRAISKWRPLSPIWVETNCTDIYRDNPYVDRCEHHVPHPSNALIVNLDMSYETLTETHIVEAYAAKTLAALGGEFEVTDRSLDLYLRQSDAPVMPYTPGGKVVAVHAGPVTWRGKEWGADKFHVVTKDLMDRGWTVILVGNVKTAPIACSADMRGRTTIHQMAGIIGASNLFIGLDSLPLHVAQAMGTPALGIFGVTSAKYILTSGDARAVESTASTAGLRHRTINSCNVDDGGEAIRAVTPESVLKAVT